MFKTLTHSLNILLINLILIHVQVIEVEQKQSYHYQSTKDICPFMDVLYITEMFLLISINLLSSLSDCPSSHPSSLPLSDSLSSGSIKSLLICSFLLIWIHTGPNCWLGFTKESSLNEVYKTHNQSLCLCVVSLCTHMHVYEHIHAHLCVCVAQVLHWLLF